MTDVFLNGTLIGTVKSGKEFIGKLKEKRRDGSLSKYMNVHMDEALNTVNIFLDKNRVIRPLIRVENGKSLLTDEHLEQLKREEIKWEDLVNQNIIEYLDPSEEENAYIALEEGDLNKEHTYLEIDPISIFSVCTSLVPYANFNMSSRLNRGQKTQKQAMGIYALNFLTRLDTSVNVLHYPQRPLVRSYTESLLGDGKVAGQNIVIAVTNYEGYNMSDAIVLNKSSIERGFGSSTYYRPYEATKSKYPGGQTDRICVPDKEVRGYGIEEEYRYLEDDGIIYPEVMVKDEEVLVGRTSPPRFLGKLRTFGTAASTTNDTSVRIRSGEDGIVSKIVITENEEGDRIITVKIRDTRKPEIGDKFASRHGQKGVVGRIVAREDLPFTASGIVPDVIFSPNSLPKRMTLGHIIEILAGKVGALNGRYVNGTSFDSEDVNDIRNELLSLGFREDGSETMYDGRTGEEFEARIFIGNMYYLRLKHQVSDKIQARSRGPVQLLTRQPTAGKAKQGGLRFGEMEKEALIAHGASMLMKERFSSDRAEFYVCNKCKNLAIFDEFDGRAKCDICGEKTNVSKIELAYAFKLLLDELKSCGINPKLILKDKF